MDLYLFSVAAGRDGESDFIPHPPFSIVDCEPFVPDGTTLVTISDILNRDSGWTAAELEERWINAMRPFIPDPDESPVVHFSRLRDLYDRRRAAKCDPAEKPQPLSAGASDQEFEEWYVRNRICPHMDLSETREFMQLCKRAGLDAVRGQVFPSFARDEHTGGYKIVLGVTIQCMRERVLKSGTLESLGSPEWCGTDGVWLDTWTSERPPRQARVFVRRKGIPDPFEGLARFSSAQRQVTDGEGTPARLSKFWERDPAGQLAKCAYADAFRKGWQDVIEGWYSLEELQNGPPAVNPKPAAGSAPDPTNQCDPAPEDPAADLPATRQAFELRLIDCGIRSQQERAKIITNMRLKFPALFAQHEDTFWQKAWSEFRRSRRPAPASRGVDLVVA